MAGEGKLPLPADADGGISGLNFELLFVDT